ncbi:hypothetical protein D8B34_05705 [Verminephrobacter eiseniae]|nr:hypothetical protein [Verminephrobacter eiseniae]MCW8184286.1 hypothetical protein [Verminephrobacter eiseniae]MCW8224029.1 hypothetical protein [Verminephrobacter eiseniae]MCW8233301.1 hypothetical protein [Verminephrobacter eiseniae]
MNAPARWPSAPPHRPRFAPESRPRIEASPQPVGAAISGAAPGGAWGRPWPATDMAHGLSA